MKKPIVKVLAVDDYPANLVALENVLRGIDIEIVKAGTGKEALFHLSNMEFACVLLDVEIPDIDGFDLAKIIRESNSGQYLPILFLSAKNRSEIDVSHGYKLGAVDYLTKPYDPNILKSKVAVFADLYRKELARRQAVEELRQARDELEMRVRERTAELMAQAEELARSNTELAQFAFISSHDLKEPLRMVSMYVQILQADHAPLLNEKAKESLKYILEGTARMQRLIESLLDYSRVGKLNDGITSVDCAKIVQDLIANYQPKLKEMGGTITCGNLPTLQAREIEIIQVFQNLVENSIKFCGDKPPKIHINATTTPQEHRFSVQDSGIGINPAYYSKIFEIFQQLHTREHYLGTGIGLSVCKKIIETRGGKIWVESKEGVGSTFYFTLPNNTPGEVSP